MMTEISKDRLSYRTRFVFGSCWPALVAFCGTVAFLFVRMCEAGYFGNPKYQHEHGEWMMIMFPIITGALVAGPTLGINAALFSVVRPQSRLITFVTGLATLPLAVAGGIGLKCLL